ncbi:MAG: hypothetical protein C0490_24350, partial [Marivirga sp.]|nr:hypothetical protein [Marivirga sp.]
MNLRRLIFRDKIPLKVEYNNLSKSFSQMDEFLVGYIGDKKANVFYRSRMFGIPLTKVQVKNNPNGKGELTIDFKMVDIVPIIFVLSIILVVRDSIVDIYGRGPFDRVITTISVSLFFYGFLLYKYYMELLDFRVTLKVIEVQWRSSNVR